MSFWNKLKQIKLFTSPWKNMAAWTPCSQWQRHKSSGICPDVRNKGNQKYQLYREYISKKVVLYSGGWKLQRNLELSQLNLWNNMNLDSLSFALAEISYSVANLAKKNFRSSVAEINHVSIAYFVNFIK